MKHPRDARGPAGSFEGHTSSPCRFYHHLPTKLCSRSQCFTTGAFTRTLHSFRKTSNKRSCRNSRLARDFLPQNTVYMHPMQHDDAPTNPYGATLRLPPTRISPRRWIFHWRYLASRKIPTLSRWMPNKVTVKNLGRALVLLLEVLLHEPLPVDPWLFHQICGARALAWWWSPPKIWWRGRATFSACTAHDRNAWFLNQSG